MTVNINSLIRKLLVSITQCLILLLFKIRNLIYNFFDRAMVAIMYEITVVIGTDIDDTGNLKDLLKVVLIDEKSGYLRVAIRAVKFNGKKWVTMDL